MRTLEKLKKNGFSKNELINLGQFLGGSNLTTTSTSCNSSSGHTQVTTTTWVDDANGNWCSTRTTIAVC